MEIVSVTEDRRVLISLEAHEVAGLINAIDQAMQAVEDWEFSILVGLDKSEVATIRQQLDEVYPRLQQVP